jgi:hypothetical protein
MHFLFGVSYVLEYRNVDAGYCMELSGDVVRALCAARTLIDARGIDWWTACVWIGRPAGLRVVALSLVAARAPWRVSCGVVLRDVPSRHAHGVQLLFGLAKPVVMYWTLMRDSQYWQVRGACVIDR